jgi:hypothetical protein
MSDHSRIAALLLAAPLALAACGGSSGSSTTTGGANYDPATAALNDAGLRVCAERQEMIPQTIGENPAVVSARGFQVSPCASKPENDVIVLQVANTTDRAVVAKKAEKVGPTFVYKSIVVVTTGPNAEENSAAIKAHMDATYGSTTS